MIESSYSITKSEFSANGAASGDKPRERAVLEHHLLVSGFDKCALTILDQYTRFVFQCRFGPTCLFALEPQGTDDTKLEIKPIGDL